MDKNRKYAVFDWDNTVREGYTLYSWVDYLCQHNIMEKDVQKNLREIENRYKRKEITHDEYANIACNEYTKALTGKSEKKLNQVIADYIKEDRELLFPETNALMKFLNKKNVDVIVISGAPTRILEQYKEEFGIKDIFALEEEVVEKSFTGKVACNYGHNKFCKVNELIKKYKTAPYLALGDSESDIPLLDSSDYPICVGNGLKKENYWNVDSKHVLDRISKNIRF